MIFSDPPWLKLTYLSPRTPFVRMEANGITREFDALIDAERDSRILPVEGDSAHPPDVVRPAISTEAPLLKPVADVKFAETS